jgi:hypothetical protein
MVDLKISGYRVKDLQHRYPDCNLAFAIAAKNKGQPLFSSGNEPLGPIQNGLDPIGHERASLPVGNPGKLVVLGSAQFGAHRQVRLPTRGLRHIVTGNFATTVKRGFAILLAPAKNQFCEAGLLCHFPTRSGQWLFPLIYQPLGEIPEVIDPQQQIVGNAVKKSDHDHPG